MLRRRFVLHQVRQFSSWAQNVIMINVSSQASQDLSHTILDDLAFGNLETLWLLLVFVNMPPLNVGTFKGGSNCYTILKPNSFPTHRPSWHKQPKPMLVVKAAASHSEGPIKKLGLSDAECEAAVVAGNVPEASPVPPVPGTPLIFSFVKKTCLLVPCLVAIGLDGDMGFLKRFWKPMNQGRSYVTL